MRARRSKGWSGKFVLRQSEAVEGAPLRKIIERLYESGSIFEPDRVRLECGHETRSQAKRKARCVACKQNLATGE